MNKIKTDKVDRVVDLRDEKGLSFREISRVMKEDLKSVYRWYRYSKTHFVGTYPQKEKK